MRFKVDAKSCECSDIFRYVEREVMPDGTIKCDVYRCTMIRMQCQVLSRAEAIDSKIIRAEHEWLLPDGLQEFLGDRFVKLNVISKIQTSFDALVTIEIEGEEDEFCPNPAYLTRSMLACVF